MKKYLIIIFLMLFGGSNSLLIFSDQVFGQTQELDHLIINELMPNPASPLSDSQDEFVEIYNPTNEIIDLAGYVIFTGNEDNYKYTITEGVIEPDKYALFYSKDTPLTLSNTGGKARLVDANGTEIDITEDYGSAPDGESWARSIDGWSWTISVTPGAENIITLPTEEDEDTSNPTPQPMAVPAGGYADLEISELLPNPKAPQTDDADEFIELYNPTDETVNLAGYKLITGNNGTYKFTFKSNMSIGPFSYQVFYSRDTKLALSNSGGKATLVAPDGGELDSTDSYGKAVDAQSWIFAEGKWQWTATPTPGASNIMTIPTPQQKTAKAAAAKTTKKKTRKSKARAGAKTLDNTTAAIASRQPAAGSNINPILLAGVGAAALLYAGYEYRHDLANQYYRLKRYRETRRTSR